MVIYCFCHVAGVLSRMARKIFLLSLLIDEVFPVFPKFFPWKEIFFLYGNSSNQNRIPFEETTHLRLSEIKSSRSIDLGRRNVKVLILKLTFVSICRAYHNPNPGIEINLIPNSQFWFDGNFFLPTRLKKNNQLVSLAERKIIDNPISRHEIPM